MKNAISVQTVIDSVDNGIVVLDLFGRVEAISQKLLEIIGVESVYSYYDLQMLFKGVTLKKIFEIKDNILGNRVVVNGHELFVDYFPHVVDDSVEGVVVVCKKTHQYLDAIMESSFDGIFITDGKGNTLRFNKSYERITGFNPDDLIGCNMKSLENNGSISESASLLAVKDKEVVTINQRLNTGKQVLVTSNPIYDSNGDIQMVVTNVRDETEIHRLRGMLKKNKEVKESIKKEMDELKNQLLETKFIVVEDDKMIDTLKMAKRAAQTEVSILVLGESGVGKEEMVKFIHSNSKRKNNKFIKINCGAIPENLIESELFGYIKGAFTGADQNGKVGLFEVANGGTLFLDEIGELPLHMQVKLLRVLQEGEIVRIGDSKPIQVDFRLVAATNCDLDQMVEEGTFRKDLLYRLNVVPIEIPPLRERKSDILGLTDYFLKSINDKYGWEKSFSSEVLKYFYSYAWPGNVRELKNCVERITVMSGDDLVVVEDLPLEFKEKCGHVQMYPTKVVSRSLKEAVEKLEYDMINKAFLEHGNVRAAAKALGIGAATLVRKRQKYEENTPCSDSGTEEKSVSF
jgi:PAS domain S-box-containing protein